MKVAWILSTLFFLASTFSLVNAKGKLIQLNEENWDDMLEGEWMVEFFAPWCPACKSLDPIWKSFASWSDDLGISVAQVDVNRCPELSGRFLISALPTIYHVKDGAFRQYHGTRGKEEFMTFIEEKEWQQLEELSPWKNPASYQMAIVAKFFKLSMVLRNVHEVITEDYGLPGWSSYIIFAIATILTGALLGLLLVCCIDWIFPVKPMTRDTIIQASGKAMDEEDLTEEDKQSDKEEGTGNNSSPSESPVPRKRKPRKAD